jgi:threonine dehydrogenase-like Zn-dependent dehydrogenase
MITYRFGFDDFAQAYDDFADAASTQALKVLVAK